MGAVWGKCIEEVKEFIEVDARNPLTAVGERMHFLNRSKFGNLIEYGPCRRIGSQMISSEESLTEMLTFLMDYCSLEEGYSIMQPALGFDCWDLILPFLPFWIWSSVLRFLMRYCLLNERYRIIQLFANERIRSRHGPNEFQCFRANLDRIRETALKRERNI
jgi:hypothetical protein